MLPPVFQTCVPRDKILAGDLSPEIFAAKLRPVVEGHGPAIYQDAATFFADTYPTQGLKRLLTEVFGRLSGMTVGSPIIRLETSFGGGKTHDEIALWHVCRQGRSIQGLDRFVDLALVPDRPIQVAAIDGKDSDPQNGIFHPETGITTYTLWGEIAYQLRGIEGYELLKGSDTQRISPGTSVLERLLGGQSTLIVLDEIARLLESAKAMTVGDSTLAKQVVAFLFSLMDLAAASNQLVLVYTLATAADAFGEETTELRELIQVSARQEQILTPSTDLEIYNIVKQRLFTNVSAEAARAAAIAYLQAYRSSSGHLSLPEGCQEAAYAQQIEESYPFHPELFQLLTKKIAAIPEFQRTRGALRLFALVVRHLWDTITPAEASHSAPATQLAAWVPMIHPHHVPIGLSGEVTNELTSRLRRESMRLPVQADIYNPDGQEAYAQLHDREWQAAGKPPFASWLSRTVFLHSLTTGTSSGVKRPELNLALLMPGVETTFIDRALERLASVAWFLDFDPITASARFKEEPSINKIIAEEKRQIGISEAKEELRTRRDTIFANRFFDLIASPQGAHDVDDRPDSVALCLIDFNEATVVDSRDQAPELVEKMFSNTGQAGKFRTFRNRLLFLVANRAGIDQAIEAAKEFRAIHIIQQSPQRLEELPPSQRQQLKERSGNADLAVRVALTNAYRHLFYPAKDDVKAPRGLMHYCLPAQDASEVRGHKNQQEAILKALKDCGKIRPDDAAPYAPAYLLQKVWPAGLDRWSTRALKEAFAKDLSLHLLLEGEVSKLRDTLRSGILQGHWDLQVGDRRFVKAEGSELPPLPPIDFSEQAILYRRGILQPPEPRKVDLSAQVGQATGPQKPVQVRWRARGASSVTLYQDGQPVAGDFAVSDAYEGTIARSTRFRLVADYGDGETATAEAEAQTTLYGQGEPSRGGVVNDQGELFQAKPQPPTWTESGTPNGAWTTLMDKLTDAKVQGIAAVSVLVDRDIDYRKMLTALNYFNQLPLEINQSVAIELGEQFVELNYQGTLRGFQSFSNPIGSWLAQPGARADVRIELKIAFAEPVAIDGAPMRDLHKALTTNPVERLSLTIDVVY